MTKIIFLDIDGPMIPMRAFCLPDQTQPFSVFDPCAVAMLNKLLAISDAKIVISSTWGVLGRDQCVEVLQKNGINPKKLHKSWITPRKFSSSRCHEIKWWLDDHPNVVDYVAIDDEDLHVDFVPKAVKCDAYEGFSWRNYLECCVHLDAYERPDIESQSKYVEYIEYMKRQEIWRTKRHNEPGQYLTWEAADLVFPKEPLNNDTD